MTACVLIPLNAAMAIHTDWEPGDPTDAADLLRRGESVLADFRRVADVAARLAADGWQLRFEGVCVRADHPAVATAAEAAQRLRTVGLDPDSQHLTIKSAALGSPATDAAARPASAERVTAYLPLKPYEIEDQIDYEGDISDQAVECYFRMLRRAGVAGSRLFMDGWRLAPYAAGLDFERDDVTTREQLDARLRELGIPPEWAWT